MRNTDLISCVCLFCFVSFNKMWEKMNKKPAKTMNTVWIVFMEMCFLKGVCNLWYFVICSKHHLLLRGRWLFQCLICFGPVYALHSYSYPQLVPSAGACCIKHIADKVQEVMRWKMLFLASVVKQGKCHCLPNENGQSWWRNHSWGSWQILGNSK